jgi:GntR family transcriptional regulator
MIEFRLDAHSGVAPYLQIVQQVKQALRLGLLEVGDQLPTVREVIAQITINPNTVFKAYRELEREGLISSRPGSGTFVRRTLASASPASQAALQQSLMQWLRSANAAGLDSESVLALMLATLRESQREETA